MTGPRRKPTAIHKTRTAIIMRATAILRHSRRFKRQISGVGKLRCTKTAKIDFLAVDASFGHETACAASLDAHRKAVLLARAIGRILARGRYKNIAGGIWPDITSPTHDVTLRWITLRPFPGLLPNRPPLVKIKIPANSTFFCTRALLAKLPADLASDFVVFGHRAAKHFSNPSFSHFGGNYIHEALSRAFMPHSEAGAVLPCARSASVMTRYEFDGKPFFFHIKTVVVLLPVKACMPIEPPSAVKTASIVLRFWRPIPRA